MGFELRGKDGPKPKTSVESMAEKSTKAVCGEEALDLQNCVTHSLYDHDECVRLLNALRECVVDKKVKLFSLADQEQKEATPASKKA